MKEKPGEVTRWSEIRCYHCGNRERATKEKPKKREEKDMEHKGTKRIETKRLLLRAFQPGDAEPMYRNWASDPEVTKFLTWPTHKSVEVSQAVVDSWVKESVEIGRAHV